MVLTVELPSSVELTESLAIIFEHFDLHIKVFIHKEADPDKGGEAGSALRRTKDQEVRLDSQSRRLLRVKYRWFWTDLNSHPKIFIYPKILKC